MNVKEFVNMIIKMNQNQIFQRVRSLPKLMSACFVSMLGILPLISIPNRGITAYAQQIQQQGQIPTTDLWYQSLETARSKVEAALSPGAFGHGVPELYNLSTNDILLTFGLAVLGGIVVFTAVKALLPYINKEKISKALRPLNKMIQ
jgi:hypothetical protein